MTTRRRSLGGVAVEAVLTIPVLLLIAGGMIDYGIVLREKAVVVAAARAGARAAASVTVASGALLRAVACQSALNHLSDSNLNRGDFEVVVEQASIDASPPLGPVEPERAAVSVTVRHKKPRWYMYFRNAYLASSTSIFVTESGGLPVDDPNPCNYE